MDFTKLVESAEKKNTKVASFKQALYNANVSNNTARRLVENTITNMITSNKEFFTKFDKKKDVKKLESLVLKSLKDLKVKDYSVWHNEFNLDAFKTIKSSKMIHTLEIIKTLS